MESNQRSGLTVAIILILAGVFFLLLNVVPQLQVLISWPILFLVMAASFYVWPFLFPSARRGLAGSIIPGTILLVLGLIFWYCDITGRWGDWSFLWTLIPGSVGLGMALADWVGRWSGETATVGMWMLMISLLVFAVFATFFGSELLQIIGPALVILGGVALLVRSFIRPKPKA